MFRLASGSGVSDEDEADRPLRADAQRSVDALLRAAKEVFATSGVDAPVREIADRAGVGVGTLYRRFPQRAHLIAAVFQREIDECSDAAPMLAAEHPPFEALGLWLQRYADFIGTKRGLAKALHSGDPAYESLGSQFDLRLRPAFDRLLEAAVAAGEVRADVEANDILSAVASLCISVYTDGREHAQRMVRLVIDGLRYGATPRA